MGDEDSRNSGDNYGRSYCAYVGLILFIISVPLIITAFTTQNWLEVDNDRKPSGTKFYKLGLWANCFVNLHDPYYYDPYLSSSYEGCRWIYEPIIASVTDIREFILPGFFIPVQICYTLCFVTMLISFVLVVVYLTKFTPEDRGLEHYIIVMGMLINLSALLGVISVIVFGSLSSSRQWAPEWQFNYLSWSFICGAVGSVLEHLSGIFFLGEAAIQWKRKYYETKTVYQVELQRPSHVIKR